MVIYLLAFIGGVLTILSPCILPVLPFVFARADQPFGVPACPCLLEWPSHLRSWQQRLHSAAIGLCA
jgi:hypothetical protein